MTILFLDFETTGLDPSAGAEPIEVACVVTDDKFRELESFEALIRPSPAAVWDAPAAEMHRGSGLFDLCRSGQYRMAVGAQLYRLTSRYASGGALHLAGNSVHFDRRFLLANWPGVEHLLHHRHLDVSSIRMLAERVVPNAPQLGGEKPHRAMADVRRSIAELHHWTAVLREGVHADQ